MSRLNLERLRTLIKKIYMRITKIIEKAPIIDADGKWNLFCQVQRGSSYVYGVIVCDTKEEAFSYKECQILDAEKTRFEHRIKNV